MSPEGRLRGTTGLDRHRALLIQRAILAASVQGEGRRARHRQLSKQLTYWSHVGFIRSDGPFLSDCVTVNVNYGANELAASLDFRMNSANGLSLPAIWCSTHT